MKDTQINRLVMFTRSLDLLDKPEYEPLWKNIAPAIFTTKVAEARLAVGAIQSAQEQQENGTSSVTEEKEREENELEEAAFVMGQAMGIFYDDQGTEGEAAEVALERSEWARLRDAQLLAKAKLVREKGTALVGGALAATASQYGITPAAVAALQGEWEDYDAIINAPDIAIAVRKALTQGFPAAYNLVEKKFKVLDRLILQYRTTDEGKAMVAAWKAARTVKDLGHGPGAPATPPTPPTP